MKHENEKLESITIECNKFYRPADIEKQLGRRCVEHLRKAGMVSVGGWVSGRMILDAFGRAGDTLFCQRVLNVEGSKKNGDTENQEKDVVKNCVRQRMEPVPTLPETDPLGSQLQALRERRQVSAKKV